MTIRHEMFTLERRLRAPVERAFRAFSEAAAKKSWFACDPAMEIAEYALDFREGGMEVNRIRTPEGGEHLFRGHFIEIVPLERIVYAYGMAVDGTRISASLVTLSFLPGETTTRLIHVEQVAFLAGDQTVAERRFGTDLGFDSLEAALPGL